MALNKIANALSQAANSAAKQAAKTVKQATKSQAANSAAKQATKTVKQAGSVTVNQDTGRTVQQAVRQNAGASAQKNNTVPVKAGTVKPYYTKPDFTDSAQLYADAKELNNTLLRREGAVYTSNAKLRQDRERTEKLLQETIAWRDSYERNPSQQNYYGYANSNEQLRLSLESLQTSAQEYDRASGDYESARIEYNSSVERIKKQEELYTDWRSTIRDGGAIQAELEEIDGKIRDLKLADAGTLAGAVTLGGVQVSEDSSQEIRELEERRALLQEEYDWNQYFQETEIRENIDQYVQDAQTAYQEYMDSEEYRIWEQGVLQDVRDGKYLVEVNGVPVQQGIPENEKVQELKNMVEYYQGIKTTMEEEAMLQRDMEELASWPEADRATLERYVAQREMEGYGRLNPLGEQSLSSARYQAALLFEKYGARKVEEMAESYTRAKNLALAQQTAREAAEGAGKSGWAGAGHSVLSIGANLLGSMTGPAGYLLELPNRTGRYSTLDPNNSGMLFNQYAGAVRQEVAGDLEEKYGSGASTLYEAGMSSADNFARLIAGGKGSLVLAATGSFGQSVSNYSRMGIDPVRAISLGLIDAGLEVATEKVSLDNLMSGMDGNPKTAMQILKHMMIQGGIEVSEEELSFLGSTLAEAVILRNDSSFNQQVAFLQAMGLSYEQAREEACKTVWKEAGQTAVQSFLSGGMMAGASATYDSVVADIRGRGVNEQEDTFGETIKNQVLDAFVRKETNGKTAQVSFEAGTTVRKGVVRSAERLSKVTGTKIRFYTSDAQGQNGYYQNGVVYVNSRSANPLATIFGHELTHSVEMADAYGELSAEILGQLAPEQEDLRQMREHKRRQYASHGVELSTDEEVDSEIVAEFAEKYLFTDERTILALVKSNPGLGGKIHNWITNILAKMGNQDAQIKQFLSPSKEIYARALAQAHPQIQTQGRGQVRNQENMQKRTITEAAETDAESVGWIESKKQYDKDYRQGRISEEEYTDFLESYNHFLDVNGLTDSKTRYSISGTYAEEIDEWDRSGRPAGEHFILGSTGEVLQGLGAIESDIYILGDKISAILKEHPEMTLEEIKRIPEIADDPVLILKSRNVYGGNRNTRLVMFGSVKAQNGQPVLCVLDLRPVEGGLAVSDMQKVNSAYTKDSNAKQFVEGSDFVYADEKRTAPLLRTIGFHMPIELQQSGYIGSISYRGQNVNIEGVPFQEIIRGEKETQSRSFAEEVTRQLTENWSGKGDEVSVRKYSYAGVKAETANKEELARAEQMAAMGLDSEFIRAQTGWFQGMDGQWRYEIDDSKMQYQRRGDLGFRESVKSYDRYRELIEKAETFMLGRSDVWLTDDEQRELTELQRTWSGSFREDGRVSPGALPQNRLSDYLKHDALYDAYPQLKDTKLVFAALPEGIKGNYNRESNTITVSKELRHAPQKVLLHEVQHIIQDIEGFSPGASVEYWKRRSGGESAKEQYLHTAGEIEARDTADRMEMDADRRKKTSPNLGDEDTVFADDGKWMTALDMEYADRPASFVEINFTEQIRNNAIHEVAQMQPVEQISGNEFAKGEVDLITQVENFFAQHDNEAYNAQLGIVILDRHGVKSDIGHGIGRKKAASYAAVPAVIEQGKVVDFQKNWKERGYDTAVIAAPILIGNQEHIAGVVVTRNNQSNRFYVHEVLTTENGAMPFKTGAQKTGDPGGDAPSIFSILNEIRAVKDNSTEKRYSYSSPTLSKRNVVNDLRAILNRGGNAAELRQYIQRMEQSSGSADQNTKFVREEGSEAEQILRSAKRRGISVEEYLRQNWEQYDSDGYWNQAAREALEQEQQRGRWYSFTDTQTDNAQYDRAQLPTKAMVYLQRRENDLLRKVGESIGVPFLARREQLKPIIQEISDTYLRTGTVSDEKIQELFERAYEEGVVVDREFYDQYKDIKKHLQNTKVTISEQDQADIADFVDFRHHAYRTLKIVKTGGLPVDTAYQELSEMAPELFPERITHPADQLQKMFEVGQSIRISERSIEEYYGDRAEEFRKYAEHDFSSAIGDALSQLHIVRNWAKERAARAEETRKYEKLEKERIMETWAQFKKARVESQKAVAKNLLTDSEDLLIGKLLMGQLQLEDIDPKEYNFRGIQAVFEAKQECERLNQILTAFKKQIRAQNLELADKYLENANQWKDKKSGILYARETMRRNIYDIVEDRELAREINEVFFEPVHAAEAKATRFKTEMRERVKALGLSRKAARGNEISEAHAVQLLGEALDNIRVMETARGRMKARDGKTLKEWRDVVTNIWGSNPNLDRAKIEGAVQEFRKIYDELFQQMNEVRVMQGYEPVNYRQGYFPHFQPGEESVLAHFGRALGIDTAVDALPTTINGLTHTFKPGIQWFGNAQERLGFNTAYDAVEGFDKYIEGVAGVIYHTENIQRLRALATQTRYRTSGEGIRKQVDRVLVDDRLTEEEKQSKIRDIYEHGKYTLSNFVAELDEYTNLLANKKSKYDRSLESLIGRKAYTIMKNVESRVGANMIAGNISSAFTNFIPLTQAWGRVGTADMLKGISATARAVFSKDGIVGMSDFLTNRRGSDVLVKGWTEKLSNVLGTPMEIIDNVVSESIVRAAYYQNVRRGLSETEAMHQADIFAASVMADRSKGSMPTLFESSNPLFKAFTQFQLEVNNQYSELFKDLPREYKGKAKWMLAAALFKYFVAAWAFNELEEKVKGRRSALDPIGIATQFFKDFKETGQVHNIELGNLTVGIMFSSEALKNLAANVAGELPFTSVLALLGIEIDGGRIPAASAFPDLPALWEAATDDSKPENVRWKEAWDELQKPLTYLLLPGGGNQISKIWKGIDAYRKGGSYSLNSKGEEILQYPIYKDDPEDRFWNMVRIMAFGKSSLPTAQDWVESDFNSLNAEQTAIYQDLLEAGVIDRAAYSTIQRLLNVTVDEDAENKAELIRQDRTEIILGEDISAQGKAILFYGMAATDKEKELMNDLINAGATEDEDMIQFVSYLHDAMNNVYGTARRQAIADIFFNSSLTDEEKSVGVAQLLGGEIEDESGNPTAYAKFLIAQQMGLDVDQYMKLYAQDANIEDCLDMIYGGMSSSGAVALTVSLASLEAEEGSSSVTWEQECNAIFDSGLSDEDQVLALEAVSYEATGRGIRIAYECGLEPRTFVDLKRVLPDYDTNGNGKYTQKEVTAAIDDLSGNEIWLAATGGSPSLTNTEKAVLWQLQTNAKDGKNNPYDKEVGKLVYDLVQGRKSEGEGEEEEDDLGWLKFFPGLK